MLIPSCSRQSAEPLLLDIERLPCFATGIPAAAIINAAYFAVAVSFFPIVSVIIGSIPSCIIGGISFVLYGMISAIGVRIMFSL